VAKRLCAIVGRGYLIDPLLEPLQLAVADKFVPPKFHRESLVGYIGEDAFRKLGELVFRQEDHSQSCCATAKHISAFAFKNNEFFKQRNASRTWLLIFQLYKIQIHVNIQHIYVKLISLS